MRRSRFGAYQMVQSIFLEPYKRVKNISVYMYLHGLHTCHMQGLHTCHMHVWHLGQVVEQHNI